MSYCDRSHCCNHLSFSTDCIEFVLIEPAALLQTGIHNSVFLPALPSNQKTQRDLPLCWDRNIKLLPGISDIKFSDVPNWTPEQVANHLKTIIPSLTEEQLNQFLNEVAQSS